MKWAAVKAVQDLYDAGFRVVRAPEWFVKPPKRATAEFRALLRADKGWSFSVPCRKGGRISGQKAHIYAFSDTHLAFTGVGERLRRRLLQAPNVRAHQTGDEEFTVVFPAHRLPLIAEVVKPHRRPAQTGSKSAGIEGFSGGSLNAETPDEGEETPHA